MISVELSQGIKRNPDVTVSRFSVVEEHNPYEIVAYGRYKHYTIQFNDHSKGAMLWDGARFCSPTSTFFEQRPIRRDVLVTEYGKALVKAKALRLQGSVQIIGLGDRI